MLSRALDSAMDFTVLPGFSRVGYAVRRRAWTGELPSMAGRTVLVTGATGGIGRAAAEDFARLGARVLVLARDRARGERAVREISAAAGNGRADVELVEGDLSSLESVRAAAAEIIEREPALHVLVNNAGVLATEREESVDGHELTFATNVLGPFLLTELLIDRLAAAGGARIVNVSSGGAYGQKLDLTDLETERRDYDGPGAYARTKRAGIVLTHEWARRLGGRGIVAHSMHPGWAATPGVASSLPRFNSVMGPLLRTPEQGADTIVWLGAAEAPGRSTGRFWHDRRERPEHRIPKTRENPGDAARLYETCRRLTGLA
jgi:dehydrogenase/reductase SDR family protein 12